METDRFFPLSTYRLQFNEQFTFAQLEEILDYLEQLGISTIYASPIFSAVPGSMHGYDGVDPHRINPAIGTLEDLRRISASLKKRGMSWIQDIVPNHMALHPDNTWLMDVLERGPASPYYNFFDIDWQHHDPQLNGRLMIPFLGETLEEAIKSKQVCLVAGENGISVEAAGLRFPLSVPGYAFLLNKSKEHPPEIVDLLGKVGREAQQSPDLESWRQNKQALFADKKTRQTLSSILEPVNEAPDFLAVLLEEQYYILTHWKETDKRLNYRRFFTINGLITLRMEDQQVFDVWHRFVHQLYEEGIIQGLRIDHIDGLMDPGEYVGRLRKLFGDKCYIIAEKILAEGEELPQNWGLDGTTGYEFLAHVNHLLTRHLGKETIDRFYRTQFPALAKYERVVREKKVAILQTQLAADWENLVRLLFQYGLAPENAHRQKVKEALGLIMASMPVYRLYPQNWPLSAPEQEVLEFAVARAKQFAPALSEEFELFCSWWKAAAEKPEMALKFLKRLMQFTGPLTAKGVEDTVFYVYNALLSHNDVGDSPSGVKCSPAQFHAWCLQRQLAFPGSLNTTTTHDTKRGEDGRMRLNTLTMLPDLWIQQVQLWHAMNSSLKTDHAPSENDEYLIYQSVISGWPGQDKLNGDFINRLSDYVIKALRESKEHTDWVTPNEEYEQHCLNFVKGLFAPDHEFISSVICFMEKVQQRAPQLSVAQLLIKLTAPGVPDIYQGCELWDFSFVDPDNRRPVDYKERMDILSTVKKVEEDGIALKELLNEKREEAWEKLYVCYKTLAFRKQHADLFREGDYVALSKDEDTVMAYARQQNEKICIVIVSLPVLGQHDHLELPGGIVTTRWRNIFTGAIISSENGKLPLTELESFPVALLEPVSG